MTYPYAAPRPCVLVSLGYGGPSAWAKWQVKRGETWEHAVLRTFRKLGVRADQIKETSEQKPIYSAWESTLGYRCLAFVTTKGSDGQIGYEVTTFTHPDHPTDAPPAINQEVK